MQDAVIETSPAAASASSPARDRSSDYAIYKPNSRGSGGVVRFGLNRTKGSVFVDASDLGPVLATLQGRQPVAKLFHQSEKANSAFELTPREDPERAPFLLSISRQDASDKSLRKVTIPLTHGEAVVLETALRAAITRLLKW